MTRVLWAVLVRSLMMPPPAVMFEIGPRHGQRGARQGAGGRRQHHGLGARARDNRDHHIEGEQEAARMRQEERGGLALGRAVFDQRHLAAIDPGITDQQAGGHRDAHPAVLEDVDGDAGLSGC